MSRGNYDAGLLAMSKLAFDEVRRITVDNLISIAREEIESAVDQQMKLLRTNISAADNLWADDRLLKVTHEWINKKEDDDE